MAEKFYDIGAKRDILAGNEITPEEYSLLTLQQTGEDG